LRGKLRAVVRQLRLQNNFGDEAVFAFNSSPEFVNCLFLNNGVGALNVRGGSLNVSGSYFSGNGADLAGLALSRVERSPSVRGRTPSLNVRSLRAIHPMTAARSK